MTVFILILSAIILIAVISTFINIFNQIDNVKAEGKALQKKVEEIFIKYDEYKKENDILNKKYEKLENKVKDLFSPKNMLGSIKKAIETIEDNEMNFDGEKLADDICGENNVNK